MYDLIDDHKDFLLINKHQGVPMHSTDNETGIISALKTHTGQAVYPVHRLDKVTSGLLLFAKNKAANSELSQQFEHRQITKFYLAISARKPKKKQGSIKGDMISARRGAWRLTSTTDNPAITQFFSANASFGRYFLLRPLTGKTHQIRVAMKSLGSPILGDKLYGDSEPQDRVYLHAYGLGFSLQGKEYYYQHKPTNGEHFKDLPELFESPSTLPWPQKGKPVRPKIKA